MVGTASLPVVKAASSFPKFAGSSVEPLCSFEVTLVKHKNGQPLEVFRFSLLEKVEAILHVYSKTTQQDPWFFEVGVQYSSSRKDVTVFRFVCQSSMSNDLIIVEAIDGQQVVWKGLSLNSFLRTK